MSQSIVHKHDIDHSLIADLEECINYGHIEELAEDRGDNCEIRWITKELIASHQGLSMHIYANEHPPPHFHVKIGGEENSFTILGCEPLHPEGGLRKYFKNIKKWHKKNKGMLAEEWNRTRPSDCVVGEIRL
ncbi:DUF4160 domain-containing protein [Halomonas sp. McH1-25]|uniref:DUF4160 domain-containing protein n=1 Tax=unclassified Halomonas TaxID=2609666 RepID=UPI001EF62422|nr:MULTISPECIES: DUF4160 domain-containing protein [unclassified Halomonas]MCG7598904.1 DUF4160 domain-containing protein [Halomonas sp. McH1-25]MCP1340867.1 DUF4160 domain-containing protein [Halomonas sp. FL8]MCP1361250.1 DUF4160 domain-containing protein [Halomonas sp. BBD45]MCP1366196.1 DUF4160 domain-containing protein [Halomonas sp. BBD48]